MLASQKFAPTHRLSPSPLLHAHVAAFSLAPSVFAQAGTVTGLGAGVVVQRDVCVYVTPVLQYRLAASPSHCSLSASLAPPSVQKHASVPESCAPFAVAQTGMLLQRSEAELQLKFAWQYWSFTQIGPSTLASAVAHSHKSLVRITLPTVLAHFDGFVHVPSVV
jgi:hypothetical protein